MKKSIKAFYTLALSLLVFASACKKNDLSPVKAEKEVTVAQTDQTAARGSDAASIGQPNALVDISEPLYNELYRGKTIEVKKISENTFLALNAIQAPIDVQPLDPCANAWADFDAYIAANLAQFQAWANQNCRPYRSCWCHPLCGLCVMFQINPTRLCPQEAYANPVRAFA
jgi:hypothetical protein